MSDDKTAPPAEKGEEKKCCDNPNPDRSIPKDLGAGYPIEVCRNCFDSGEPVSFSHALYLLKKFPIRVARNGWNGKGMWIELVDHSELPASADGVMKNLPYLQMKTAGDELVPWLASQTDLLAEDWVLVK